MSKIVFRFRVTFEDVDDVERIIDVSGRNTFRDFHYAIQDAINFDRIKPASFFKATDLWRPKEEFCTEPKANAKAAGASELAKQIDDPYQKFLYIYDAEGGNWNLRAEVVKLSKEEDGINYPHLVKSIGTSPRQYIDPTLVINDPSAKLFKEADSLIKDLGELMAVDELSDDDIEPEDFDEETISDEDDKEDEDEEEDDDDEFNLYGEEVDESEI